MLRHSKLKKLFSIWVIGGGGGPDVQRENRPGLRQKMKAQYGSAYSVVDIIYLIFTSLFIFLFRSREKDEDRDRYQDQDQAEMYFILANVSKSK